MGEAETTTKKQKYANPCIHLPVAAIKENVTIHLTDSLAIYRRCFNCKGYSLSNETDR